MADSITYVIYGRPEDDGKHVITLRCDGQVASLFQYKTTKYLLMTLIHKEPVHKNVCYLERNQSRKTQTWSSIIYYSSNISKYLNYLIPSHGSITHLVGLITGCTDRQDAHVMKKMYKMAYLYLYIDINCISLLLFRLSMLPHSFE